MLQGSYTTACQDSPLMLERPHIDYVPHVARDPHTVLRVPILPEGPKVPNHHAVRGSLKDVPNEGSCSARKCGRMYPGGNSSRLTFAVLLPQVTTGPFKFYSLSLSLMYNLLAIQLYSCYEHSFYWEKLQIPENCMTITNMSTHSPMRHCQWNPTC